MIEWICGQWYLVKKALHLYEDYTWQWRVFRNEYKKPQYKLTIKDRLIAEQKVRGV